MLRAPAGRFSSSLGQALEPVWLTVPALAAIVVYLGGLAWAFDNTSYDVWGALLIAPALMALTVPLARRAAVHEHDTAIARLIIAGMVLKLAASVVRYLVAFGVYGGTADAGVYHLWGQALSEGFRDGRLDLQGQSLMGTGFVRILTGVVYTFTGPTKLGGFFVFAWIGFWGLFFFYRAFRLALPDANHRRYAILVLFLPSMLFWPSSLGKEAWMCLCLGVAVYGAARLLTHQRGGAVLLVLGLTGAAMVRPHVAILLFVSLVIAYLLRRPRQGSLGLASKAAGIALLVVGGMLLLHQVESYFGITVEDAGGASAVLSLATSRSSQGGSEFTTVSASNPIGYPIALATVLFRPLPFEARNIQVLLASMEGMLLLGLTFLSLGRAVQLVRNLRRWPYATLSLAYVMLFGYAFASIANFGILTRQRVQVLPFLLVLLCLPTGRELRTRDRADELAGAAV